MQQEFGFPFFYSIFLKTIINLKKSTKEILVGIKFVILPLQQSSIVRKWQT